MKSILKIGVLLIVIATMFTACNEDEDLTGPGQLEITVRFDSQTGDLAKNARFSLAETQQNLNSGIYFIEDAISNNLGIVYINNLDPGEYYYDCISGNFGEKTYYCEGKIIINSEKTTTATIVMLEKG